jgi:hypothetical protein
VILVDLDDLAAEGRSDLTKLAFPIDGRSVEGRDTQERWLVLSRALVNYHTHRTAVSCTMPASPAAALTAWASVAERPVALPPENQGAIRDATAIPTNTAAVR